LKLEIHFVYFPLIVALRVVSPPCVENGCGKDTPFASSARTRNLTLTPHRSLAMGHSFTVGHVGCGILFHIGLKMSVLWGTLWDWWGRTLRDCYFSQDWSFFSSGIHWALIPYRIILLCFCSYFWRRWAGSALILVWCRSSIYRRIVTVLM
jgi:hypothetical protein